jgi:anti-sigma B factor antagonist
MLADGFEVTVVGGVARVVGEIDTLSAPALDEVLAALPDRVDLDLQEVSFLDSAGVLVLVRQHRRRCENGGSLRVVGSSRAVRRVLEITGLLELLSGCRPGLVEAAPSTIAVEAASRLDCAG